MCLPINHVLVAPSMPAAASSVASQHATAFVYPMSPARQQQHQQPVGSSVPSAQPVQQEENRGSVGETSAEGGEGDNAIVSSSDDQPTQEEVIVLFDLLFEKNLENLYGCTRNN